MGIVSRIFAIGSDTKDEPGGSEHGVHGGSGSWEEFDKGANGDRRKELLDEVVVFSEIEFPVKLSGGIFISTQNQHDKSRKELRFRTKSVSFQRILILAQHIEAENFGRCVSCLLANLQCRSPTLAKMRKGIPRQRHRHGSRR